MDLAKAESLSLRNQAFDMKGFQYIDDDTLC